MKRKIKIYENAITEDEKIYKSNKVIQKQSNNIQQQQVKRDLNYNPYKPISRPNDYTLNEWMHGTDTGKVANRVETRLNISNPKDALEQEADKVANDVLNMKDTKISSSAKNNIHLKESSTGKQVNANLENELSKLSGGQPLSKSDKSFFETRMSTDLSSVKIYNNEHAHKLAKSLNAKAFTRGTDIVFAKGEYNTKSSEGKKLLAHELAHVVQGGIGIKRKQNKYKKSIDYNKLKLLNFGIWTNNANIKVYAGQGIIFRLKNINILSTTITISSNIGQTETKTLLPLQTVELYFNCFGEEPLFWDFEISFLGDAYSIQWELLSNWSKKNK